MQTELRKSGYYTIADGRYINYYTTLEEAKEHIKFQKEVVGSKSKWEIAKVTIEYQTVE